MSTEKSKLRNNFAAATLNQSMFSHANTLLRQGRLLDAIDMLTIIQAQRPELSKSAEFNKRLATKRIKAIFNSASADLVNVHLTPLIDVEAHGQQSNAWIAVGEDPHFELSLQSGDQLIEGWYSISLLIEAAPTRTVSKLYLDFGRGHNEDDTIILDHQTGQLANRVFHLPTTALSARFDPQECKGSFNISVFRLQKISQAEAATRMLAHIFLCHGPVFSESLQKMKQEISRQARKQNRKSIEILADWHANGPDSIEGLNAYHAWIADFEKPNLPSLAEARHMAERFSVKPKFSVIVPTYNTDATYLKACIDSVLTQSYPYWELCIADDASPKPHVQSVLNYYMELDDRIKVIFRPENGHISEASNSAIELATGDFVALLDHDDMLAEHALFFVVQALQTAPHASIFYSDEDKLDLNGKRIDPHFKSDWNPDLFFSQNYVSHLGIYKRSLLNNIGGFRKGVEGSQDQDLLLRCLPHVSDREIIHIPRILYHWRTVEGSTALAAGEKSYTTQAGLKALTDYFRSACPEAKVEAGLLPNTYRVRWPLPKEQPLVSLLIPTRDRRTLTETCVRSILEKSQYVNFEIIILDNGSVEKETLEFFEQIQEEDKRVKVIRYDHPFNYSAINNYGVKHACGEIIGLINNDIEVISPEWLSEMVSHATREDIGCVGAKLYYSSGEIQHAGVVLGIGGVAGHSHKHFSRNAHGYFSRLKLIQSISAVTAACLVVRKSVYEEVGGLDEDNLKVAFNDVDFCLKVRQAGYRNLWTPYAEMYHHESVSRGAEDTPEKVDRFSKEVAFMKAKWGNTLEYDPYYSPHLSSDHEDFRIKR